MSQDSGDDSAEQRKTGQDKTRQDKTRQDKTRQDKTRQDKTRQDGRSSEKEAEAQIEIRTETEEEVARGTRSKRTSAVTRTSTEVPSPHSNRLNLLIQGWAAHYKGNNV